MTAPTWMTDGASEVRRAQIEKDHARILRDRRSIPRLGPVTVQVVDVEDASLFPEIAAARKWVAEQRKGGA